MMIDLIHLTIKKAHEHLIGGDFSARELADAYLKNIEEKNPEINAYIEVFGDTLKQAEEADKEIAVQKEKSSALTGIPLAIKDNILIKGRKVSCGSKILENYKATYDATAIAKLKKAGAVFLGRANMDEFAMGSSTERSAFGPTKNPHDTSRSPGGSSGGPAATVAMDGALAALGSDTGGSVRQPASFCGVVGLKPTYGAVSRYGLIAMASSLDQIGPLAKNAEDAEIIFNAIKGKDPLDSTSVEPTTYPGFAKRSGAGNLPPTRLRQGFGGQATSKLTIGVPSFLFEKEALLDEDVLKNFNDSIEALKTDGHKIVEVEMPLIKYALPVYYIIMPAEASTNLARFDGVRYGLHKDGARLFDDYADTRGTGFGLEVRRRILLGAHVLSSGYHDAYYRKAMAVQRIIRDDCDRVFKDVDSIVTPTSPTPAFKLGERLTDPVAMYLSDILTVVANIGGFPAISIPSGTANRGGSSLPLGLQFMAPHFREDILFATGKKFELQRKSV